MPRRLTSESRAPARGSHLTRRELLEAGAGTLFATAGMSAAVVPRARATPAAAIAPTLAPPSADVWAPTLSLRGTPADARLTASGQPLATSREAGTFAAQLQLRAPQTNVVATNPHGAATAGATYTARLAHGPTARIAVAVEGQNVRLDAGGSESSAYSRAPITSIAWQDRDGASLGSGPALVLTGPFADGEHYVTATVSDDSGLTDAATAVFEVASAAPATVDLQTWQPRWAQEAVVYGAVPPLFGSPPLDALTAALDRLRALGVTVLWLAPVFACVEGDFGYQVTDHFSVRPDYGDLSSLRALVDGAHERGLRVILDLPLNDTSSHHPYFRQCARLGRESHYWDFYARDAGGHPTHYFNYKTLPNLDYDDAEVRAMATEVASYWLRVADVDGFRCDAAWGVQERRPGFWAQWSAELKRIRPDLLLIAEAGALDNSWATAGFSAAYDWTATIGEWSWSSVFRRPASLTARLGAALGAPLGSRAFRFLENNDTGDRFVTRYGPGLTKAASALLLALPGIPCIYTGQEIGAEYQPYRRTRPLNWREDPLSLEPYLRELIAARAGDAPRADARPLLLSVSPSAQVLAFAAETASGAVAFAINFSAADVTATVAAPGAGEAAWSGPVPAFSRVSWPLRDRLAESDRTAA